MDYLPQFPDKYFELAIVDPPYGIHIEKSGRLKKYNTNNVWDDKPPDQEYFKELFRVSKNQIIWGGNYFGLPATKCFLIWDKKQPENISFASCEYAWTSFSTSAKTFYFSPLTITISQCRDLRKIMTELTSQPILTNTEYMRFMLLVNEVLSRLEES